MDGVVFYKFLRRTYKKEGDVLYGNYTFNNWLEQPDGSFSLRFNDSLKEQQKAIPQNIIIAAWEANMPISDQWLKDNFKISFRDDSRLRVLNFLLSKYRYRIT